jgi:hypothetical protein
MRSRGDGVFADRVLAALRNQFGGHAVRSAAADGTPRGKAKGKRKRAATGGRRAGT